MMFPPRGCLPSGLDAPGGRGPAHVCVRSCWNAAGAEERLAPASGCPPGAWGRGRCSDARLLLVSEGVRVSRRPAGGSSPLQMVSS